MDNNELIKKFSNLKCDTEKKKRKFINENEDVKDYLENISKISIEIAKMNLRKDPNLEKKNNLTRKLNTLMNDKRMYTKANKLNYRCSICKDNGIFNGKTCKCLVDLVKEEKYEILSKQLPLCDFKFEKFSTDFYSDVRFINGESHKCLMSRNLKNCRNYAKAFGVGSPNMLFCGPTGLGKTHLAGSIINVLLEKGFDVSYFSASNLIHEIDNKRFCNGDVPDSGFGLLVQDNDVGSIFESDLLVIDDLGSEFITKFSTSIIYNVLNIRIMKKLPVIITTNLDVLDLERRYSKQITSRIIGNYFHIKFVGNDIRQKNMSNIMKKKVSDRDAPI